VLRQPDQSRVYAGAVEPRRVALRLVVKGLVPCSDDQCRRQFRRAAGTAPARPDTGLLRRPGRACGRPECRPDTRRCRARPSASFAAPASNRTAGRNSSSPAPDRPSHTAHPTRRAKPSTSHASRFSAPITSQRSPVTRKNVMTLRFRDCIAGARTRPSEISPNADGFLTQSERRS
jgi:hypothetical protein